jgi:hypothetical protein
MRGKRHNTHEEGGKRQLADENMSAVVGIGVPGSPVHRIIGLSATQRRFAGPIGDGSGLHSLLARQRELEARTARIR